MVRYVKPTIRSEDIIDRRQTARFQGLANRERIRKERERAEALARLLNNGQRQRSGGA